VRRDTRIVAAVLAAISTVILSASLLCTWAVAAGASPKWRLLFRVFCHGIPHRCFELWNTPMPICARCTAIYIGLLAGILFFALLPLMRELVARRMMFAAAVPMLIDGLTQLTTLRESTNPLRFATGIIAGIAFSHWALTSVETAPSQILDEV
jgi:uncharacterized membrane protein